MLTGFFNFPVKYRFIFLASTIWCGLTDSSSIHLVFNLFVTKYTYTINIYMINIVH